MLRADPVPRSNDAALQERKRALDCVRMNDAVNVALLLVLNRLVLESAHCLRVARHFVRDDQFGILRDVFKCRIAQRLRRDIVNVNEPDISAPLADADDDVFIVGVPPALFAARMTGISLRADVGFVKLYDTIEFRLVEFSHGVADAVTEIPRRLVAHAQHALDLIRAHALARFAHQHDGKKPLLKRQVRVVKYGSGKRRKLVAAIEAFELEVVRESRYALGIAAGAFNAARPAQALQIFAASFFRRVEVVEFR